MHFSHEKTPNHLISFFQTCNQNCMQIKVYTCSETHTDRKQTKHLRFLNKTANYSSLNWNFTGSKMCEVCISGLIRR